MERVLDFYPDSDDTYLLIDSIEKDLDSLGRKPSCTFLSVEVGPGGGLVSKNFLRSCSKRQYKVFHLAVDVNERAALETQSVCSLEGAIECITGDMLTFCRTNVQVDVIICNPPYVPSSPINRARCIRASYAGGELGREFIDRFLPVVAVRLKREGVLYFLLEKRNNVEEVCRIALEQYGLKSTLVLERRIPGEHLFVFKFRFAEV